MRLYFLSQAFRTPSARRGRITALTHCYVCSPKRKRRRRERKYSLALYHRKIHHLQYDHDRAVTLQPHDDGIGSCCFYDLNCTPPRMARIVHTIKSPDTAPNTKPNRRFTVLTIGRLSAIRIRRAIIPNTSIHTTKAIP